MFFFQGVYGTWVHSSPWLVAEDLEDLIPNTPSSDLLYRQLCRSSLIFSSFSQNWVLTVNLSKTKTRILEKSPSLHQIDMPRDTVTLRRTKNYTYLGINMNTTGYFNKAVNDLKDKARRAFYAIKRNIKLVTPIRSGSKYLMQL